MCVSRVQIHITSLLVIWKSLNHHSLMKQEMCILNSYRFINIHCCHLTDLCITCSSLILQLCPMSRGKMMFLHHYAGMRNLKKVKLQSLRELDD